LTLSKALAKYGTNSLKNVDKIFWLKSFIDFSIVSYPGHKIDMEIEKKIKQITKMKIFIIKFF
jgi:hypothetical protein